MGPRYGLVDGTSPLNQGGSTTVKWLSSLPLHITGLRGDAAKEALSSSFSLSPMDESTKPALLTSLTYAPLLGGLYPRKILCVGRNYAAHAKELGHDLPKEPLLFLKPSSSILEHGGIVQKPACSSRVEHESELALIIGKRMKHTPISQALSHVFGYTCALDVTARDLQRSDVQFTRAKGFDTFCPLGPTIETEFDPAGKSISCFVNGERKQAGRTSDMVWDVASLLSYMSFAMTLEPGDVILTGTPEGVGPLFHNDVVRVEIEGLDPLEISVRDE